MKDIVINLVLIKQIIIIRKINNLGIKIRINNSWEI